MLQHLGKGSARSQLVLCRQMALQRGHSILRQAQVEGVGQVQEDLHSGSSCSYCKLHLTECRSQPCQTSNHTVKPHCTHLQLAGGLVLEQQAAQAGRQAGHLGRQWGAGSGHVMRQLMRL